jgi:hypothetical protein
MFRLGGMKEHEDVKDSTCKHCRSKLGRHGYRRGPSATSASAASTVHWQGTHWENADWQDPDWEGTAAATYRYQGLTVGFSRKRVVYRIVQNEFGQHQSCKGTK